MQFSPGTYIRRPARSPTRATRRYGSFGEGDELGVKLVQKALGHLPDIIACGVGDDKAFWAKRPATLHAARHTTCQLTTRRLPLLGHFLRRRFCAGLNASLYKRHLGGLRVLQILG